MQCPHCKVDMELVQLKDWPEVDPPMPTYMCRKCSYSAAWYRVHKYGSCPECTGLIDLTDPIFFDDERWYYCETCDLNYPVAEVRIGAKAG